MSRFSRPSASALGRFLQLGGTGARIAGNLLVQRITPGKARIDWQPVGELLGDALGQMKGPVLKLGQQASQWQDLLPEPISAALARLQNQVPSLPFAALEANLQRLYDGRLYDLFESIEPTPAAAASLGQVHRARDRQGRALIMKVQYPGIHAICEADLRQLRRLMPLGRLFGTPPARLEAVYTELQRAIGEELDYAAERENLEAFRAHFSGWPGIGIPFGPPPMSASAWPKASASGSPSRRSVCSGCTPIRIRATWPGPSAANWWSTFSAACCAWSRVCWPVTCRSSRRCAARPARRSRRASRCSADVSLAACRRTGCIGAST